MWLGGSDTVGQWVGAVVRVDGSERGGDVRLVGSGDVGNNCEY